MGGTWSRAVCRRAESTGEFIGRVGLNYWEQFNEVELGWTLKAETWGRGYATEAARACLDWVVRPWTRPTSSP
ncbi:GNAT family N-acetyltransferase [Streptomyces sp. NPDC048404]|uniref:GNAT family N-acetyltransferase n=1 Tax=unclassified Streptomyces TaxID=2593676 RepID=UPI00341A6B74